MTDSTTNARAAHSTDRFHVVIAGGGVAGLEAAFAMREFARDRVRVTIVAPTDAFVYRPMAVAEPFSSGSARHYSLPELADRAGAELLQDALVDVNPGDQRVRTAGGTELSYDALVICLGASLHARFEHATTLDDAHMDDLLHGLVQDIEGGYVHSLAVVVPDPMPWPLPAYEFSLMASERAWDMQTELSVTLLTPEDAPLAIFGAEASEGVSQLLHKRKIEVVTSADCEIPTAKTIRIRTGNRSLEVDSIIALPELRGPAITGLPRDTGGFIPIDQYAAVPGVQRVWAAGDATDFRIKHGGVSAQMADTAARSIAALAGASVTPQKFEPVLDGVLLTGSSPRSLRGQSITPDDPRPGLRKLEHGDPTPKIAATYLAPHLTALSPRPSDGSKPLPPRERTVQSDPAPVSR
jgi:sulfide:quinone oxidoreductase